MSWIIIYLIILAIGYILGSNSHKGDQPAEKKAGPKQNQPRPAQPVHKGSPSHNSSQQLRSKEDPTHKAQPRPQKENPTHKGNIVQPKENIAHKAEPSVPKEIPIQAAPSPHVKANMTHKAAPLKEYAIPLENEVIEDILYSHPPAVKTDHAMQLYGGNMVFKPAGVGDRFSRPPIGKLGMKCFKADKLENLDIRGELVVSNLTRVKTYKGRFEVEVSTSTGNNASNSNHWTKQAFTIEITLPGIPTKSREQTLQQDHPGRYSLEGPTFELKSLSRLPPVDERMGFRLLHQGPSIEGLVIERFVVLPVIDTTKKFPRAKRARTGKI